VSDFGQPKCQLVAAHVLVPLLSLPMNTASWRKMKASPKLSVEPSTFLNRCWQPGRRQGPDTMDSSRGEFCGTSGGIAWRVSLR